MEPVDVVLLAAQLKKLTKDELINLIIHKDVTSITALSDLVIEQINIVLNGSESPESVDGGESDGEM